MGSPKTLRSSRYPGGLLSVTLLGVTLAACTSTVAGSALPASDLAPASTSAAGTVSPPAGTTTAAPATPSTAGTTTTERPTTSTTATAPTTTAASTAAAEVNFGVDLNYDFLDDKSRAGIVEFARLLVEEDGAGIGSRCKDFNAAALDRTWSDKENRTRALDLMRAPNSLTKGDNGYLTWENPGLDGSMIGNYQNLPSPCYLLLSSAQSAQDPIGCYDAAKAGELLDNPKIDERWSYCFMDGYFAVGGQKAGTLDGAGSAALLREKSDGSVVVVLPATKSFDKSVVTDDLTLPPDAISFLLDPKRWKSLNDNID